MLEHKKNKKLLAYYLLTPTVLIIVLLTIFPMLYSLYMSVTNYALNINKAPSFIGLNNFVSAFKDVRFVDSVSNTVKIAIPALALELLFGLGLALVLNRKFKFRGIIIALLVTPVMIAPSAAALAFRLLYNPQYGPFNDMISRIYGKQVFIDWLGDDKLALGSITMVEVWQMTPFVMLVLLAGLSAISPQLYEAGRIDGAGSFALFRYITLPLLMPVMTVVLLFRTIDLLKFFDLVFILTMGGPAASTETISFYTYFVALRHLRVGYGAALSFIILIGVSLIITILIKTLKKREA